MTFAQKGVLKVLQREILNRLSRGEFRLIGDDTQILHRDIYDHVVRRDELNQTLRDSADNAMAMYLSSVANRQNETMRVLSIVATIFLPLVLFARVYGMNFGNMPELKWSRSYFAVLELMVTVISVIIWRFRARALDDLEAAASHHPVKPSAVEPKRPIGYISHLTKWHQRIIGKL